MIKQLLKLTKEEFIEEVVTREANAVIELGAEWSGSSQMLLNSLVTIANHESLPLPLYHMDSEHNPFLFKLYNIDTLPALLFFRSGILIDKLPGMTSRNTILEKINHHFTA